MLFLSLSSTIITISLVHYFNQSAEAEIITVSGDFTTTDLVVKKGDTLKILDGVTLTITGTATNFGTINISGTLGNDGILNNEKNVQIFKTRSFTTGVINNEGFIANGGTINNRGTISNTASGVIYTIKKSVINNSYIISNYGDLHFNNKLINNNYAIIKNYNVFLVYGQLINNGRIMNYVQHIPIPNSDLGYISLPATITNYGVIQNKYGGTFTNDHAIVTNHDSIENKYGGTFTNLGTVTSYYGAISNDGTMTNHGNWMEGRLYNLDNGEFVNRGIVDGTYLQNSNNFINELGGNIINDQSILNIGLFANKVDSIIINNGEIQNGYEGHDALINNKGEIQNWQHVNNYSGIINYAMMINEEGAYINNLLTPDSFINNIGTIINHDDFPIDGIVTGNAVVQD